VSLTARIAWPSREDGRTVWYRPGDQIPEDHPKRDWLLRSGIAVDADLQPAPEPTPAPAPEPKHAVSDAPAPDCPSVKRPAKAASIDSWRTYAVARGIDPKGMSKKDLIAALR
jgi:hypothetical protein